MIKICGALLMLICSYAFQESSDLVFVQGFIMGLFICFSEALYSFAVEFLGKKNHHEVRGNNAQA